MTKIEARDIALAYITARETAGCQLVLLDDCTLEKTFGWVFFYDSKRHVETGNISYALVGNAPIVVTKADGRVHVTGTAMPLEFYLKQFDDAESQ
jgi:hypothetical protein